MDKLEPMHLKMLQYGGNRKFLEFLNIYKIPNDRENLSTKYLTKAASLYREKIYLAATTNKEQQLFRSSSRSSNSSKGRE